MVRPSAHSALAAAVWLPGFAAASRPATRMAAVSTIGVSRRPAG
ncbi:hypothetical protein BZL30_8075 [Mycobacterium kansasii]|uniref:Uncharacterized protein n=1 Tax=Mycobacterium kansasii TaxID=1768 RepID=A0A1V3WHU5_MYCKA|nr:hypothetical protein BZL30_8075 [Mycobacterium kansasii]